MKKADKSISDDLHNKAQEMLIKHGRFANELYLYDALFAIRITIQERVQTLCQFFDEYYLNDIKEMYEKGIFPEYIRGNMKMIYTITPKHPSIKALNVGSRFNATELHMFEIYVDFVCVSLKIEAEKNKAAAV